VVADLACIGLYVPVDITVQRLQLPGRYKNVTAVVTEIWNTEGLFGFYRGFSATVLTSAMWSGIWWTGYENLKKGAHQLVADWGQDLPPTLHHIIPNICAGFTAGK